MVPELSLQLSERESRPKVVIAVKEFVQTYPSMITQEARKGVHNFE